MTRRSNRGTGGRGGRMPVRKLRRPPWEKRSPGTGALIAGGVVAALLLAAAIWFLVSRPGSEEVTPTPVEMVTEIPTFTVTPTATQTATPSLSPTPTVTLTPTRTPIPTITPTLTATATPIPVVCTTLRKVWVRNQPRDESTGLDELTANTVVYVFGIVPSETGSWYELAGYPESAFVPVAAVNCP